MHKTIRPSLLLILLLAAGAQAQTALSDEGAARLKSQAEECASAFLSGEYERLADCTYPKVVELMGGREKMAAFVRKGMDEIKAEGFETISYTTGAPAQVLKVGGETYAVLPAKLRMKAPGGVLVGESFMIGVSSDEGKSWKFVSGNTASQDKLKILFPAAAGLLKFPAPKPPALEPAP